MTAGVTTDPGQTFYGWAAELQRKGWATQIGGNRLLLTFTSLGFEKQPQMGFELAPDAVRVYFSAALEPFSQDLLSLWSANSWGIPPSLITQ
ncbi:hypothetical protein LguiB_021685 [Lonicera macranthoides]